MVLSGGEHRGQHENLGPFRVYAEQGFMGKAVVIVEYEQPPFFSEGNSEKNFYHLSGEHVAPGQKIPEHHQHALEDAGIAFTEY